jgi:hypothetical protein
MSLLKERQIGNCEMERPLGEQLTRALSADQSESGRLKHLRLRQMRRDARVRAAQAQKAAAQAAERTGRYILWSVILAAISATITAVAVFYSIVADLANTSPQ